jgi:sugar/nucleoside kinase (ribokinase family)/D-arabinose 5-phosphate isomerase GutQ
LRADFDLVGIGAMVVDRVHRAARIVGRDEKGPLQPIDGGASMRTFIGGVVLNQLGWASALGARTGIFGKGADDDNGRILRAAMDRAGIVHHLVLDGSASAVAAIFVEPGGERAIYFDPAATAETTAAHVRENHAEFLARGARLSTEVHQLPLEAVHEALLLARKAGLATTVDLDQAPSEAVPALGDAKTLDAVLRMADLLKPSKRGARELLGAGEDTDALSLAKRLRQRFGNRAVVVTDGEIGCAVASDEFEGAVAAPRVHAIDATGAGDAFLGALHAGLHQGLSLRDAAKLGNAAGAACVERMGAFPADLVWARSRTLALYDGAPFVPRATPPDPTAAAMQDALGTMVEELSALRDRVDSHAYLAALALIRDAEAAGGRVHVTGVGKPEHLARYGASLLSSTGTPSAFLHATETVHGSAGQIVPGDVVIAISNSGRTQELLIAIATLRAIGAKIIGVTGDPASPLAKESDVVLDARVGREGGGLGLAPRASIAAELLVLATLSAGLEVARGFTREEYHARHPGGALGQISKPKR